MSYVDCWKEFIREGSELGPEYNIPLNISYGVYNVFQRYWEGQSDPLYAVLSRRGDSVDWVTVEASQEEADRMREVAEEIVSSSDDPMEKRTAQMQLDRLKDTAPHSEYEQSLQQSYKGLNEAEWQRNIVGRSAVQESREINYSDVRREYETILAFLKQDILQKTGAKYVADALEMLANDIRDQLHSPDPHNKDNWAYFDRESGTQPNLNERTQEEDEQLQENALLDFAMLDYLWKNLKVPGIIDDYLAKKKNKGGGKSVNDKIDDWFKNNMGNPLVRGLYRALMMTGPNYGDNYADQYKRGELEETPAARYEDLTKEQIDTIISHIREKKVNR